MTEEKSCFNCRHIEYYVTMRPPTCEYTGDCILTTNKTYCKKWEAKE